MNNLEFMAKENRLDKIKAAEANGVDVYKDAEKLMQIAKANKAEEVVEFYKTYFASIVGNVIAH